jgi:hypothetical protein
MDPIVDPRRPQQGAELIMANDNDPPRLEIAFPKSETELRLVFSHGMESKSLLDPNLYRTRSGLQIREARLDERDPSRVTLVTDPMNGEGMELDVIEARGVRTTAGESLQAGRSPEFIQGIASIPETQKPAEERFPFASRFVGKIASESCGKDGGVDSNTLIDTLGFAFIHKEAGGPFNSLKIVTQQHIPGITESVRQLQRGLTIHVLWAGGEIRNVDGENQLVDTGFMEGSIIDPTPLKSPPSFPIKTGEIAREVGHTLRAKSLQGVVARFDGVTIDNIYEPDERGLRAFSFHDDSRVEVRGLLLHTVTMPIQSGQEIHSLRGLIHQPSAGEYEVIVEMDQHLVLSADELFGHVILVEGYALPGFAGCHALVTLRDNPGQVVAALTTDQRLQTLLETALATGNLIAFRGQLLGNPPTPRGGTWAVDVYGIDGVIVYDVR